jgi:ribosomal protein S18 acetylase RimI-like enzyme
MIRAYREGDLPILMEIADRAWREIYQMFNEAYGDELFAIIVPDPENSKGEQIRSHVQSHPDWIFVCEEEGEIAGFVTFRLREEQKIGEIGNNAVHPDWRQKGIAQQLYAAALQHFRDQGMRFARVQTGMDGAHAPARRAYERAGFDIHHEDITYHMKL